MAEELTKQEEVRLYNKKYKKEHQIVASHSNHRYNQNNKTQLIDFLGGKCKICEIADNDVLEVDHKFNDGVIDRQRFPHNNSTLYYLKHLRKAKKKLQILCANCNKKKSFFLIGFQRLERHGCVGF